MPKKQTLAALKAALQDSPEAANEFFKKQFTPGFYHGSPSPNITSFDPLKSTVRDVDFVTPGVTFATRSPNFADSFTNGKGPYISLKTGDAVPAQAYTKGATMYPISIDLTNHFDPNTPEGFEIVRQYVAKKYADDPQMAAKFKSRILDPHSNWSTMESPSFLQHLRDTGHTSFAVNESGYQNVGVLDPSKIRGKFAKYNPEDAESADFMKADGGLIEHYEGGGKVGALASLVKPAVNRLNMNFKDVTKRIPELQESAQNIIAGTGSREAHEALVNMHKPVTPYSFVPQPAGVEEARDAVGKKINKNGVDLWQHPIPEGHPVGLRLDIPAYTNKGVWVNSIHNEGQKGLVPNTSYSNISAVKNASFEMPQDDMLAVAAGASKTPKARIMGGWNPVDEESAVANAQAYLNHPDWRQVGMDPERHGYFYDRHTMDPITHAEEVLQIGPLVLAKKPVYGKKEDFKFADGGSTTEPNVDVFSMAGNTREQLEKKMVDKQLLDALTGAPAVTYQPSKYFGEVQNKQPTFDTSAHVMPIPSPNGMPGMGYMPAPVGGLARLQLQQELADQAKLRAAVTGTAMAIPGQHGVKMMPGQIETGYNTPVGKGNLDVGAFRTINPIPGKGHIQGLNARYTMKFKKGGSV